jgi:predicted GIY-YIG superfamily endonuclease
MAIIYLLHFERSYRHARHYLGWTENLEQRLAQHRAGRGSRRRRRALLPLRPVSKMRRSFQS